MTRAIILMTLTACAGTPRDWSVSTSSVHLGAILTATAALNEALGCEALRVRAGECTGGGGCIRDVAGALLTVTPGEVGECDGPSSILLDRDLSVAATEVIVLHELGHAFGLEHTPTGVMAESPGFLAPGDVTELARLIKLRGGYSCY